VINQWPPLPNIKPVRINCDFTDTEVHTTPQAELDRCYVDLLEAQLKRAKQLMTLAQVYCRAGMVDRAQATLSQAVNE
jgi:hypothetical protein